VLIPVRRDAIEIWIVQHAEKEREAANPADPGLTELGRRQAQRTAAYLAEAGEAGPFQFLYSSPLLRARQTAELIAERLGLPVRLDARLRERMNWGEAPHGAPPQPLDAFLREWERTTHDRDYVPSSGDSSRAAGERFRLLLGELGMDRPDDNHSPGGCPLAPSRSVLVSHGGVTVDLLRSLFGDHAMRSVAPYIIEQGIPSCGITRVMRREGAWTLVGVGSVGHLAGDESAWRVS
jgi:broad specificity phosphatase PhoE